MGRKPIGDIAMTNAERVRRHRIRRLSVDDLSLDEVTQRLGITLGALNQWMKGTATYAPLPVFRTKAGDNRLRVFVKKDDLTGWLSKHRPDLVDRASKTGRVLL